MILGENGMEYKLRNKLYGGKKNVQEIVNNNEGATMETVGKMRKTENGAFHPKLVG